MGYRYELSGVLLESDFPLTSLPPEALLGEEPALRVRLSEAAPPEPSGDWMMVRTIDGVPWLSVKRIERGYFLSIPSYADFTLDRGRAELRCAPAPDCPIEILEQLFIDQIFPLALHAIGRFALHASAVATVGGGVIAFLGRAGLGKSTLASSLADAAFAHLFSDDCLALIKASSTVLVHPSYPSSRLWPPSADALFHDKGELPLVSPRTSKRRVVLPSARGAATLSRVYLLEQSDSAPCIERLSRRDALAELVAHLYRLDFEDKHRLAEEIELLSHVVTHAVVAKLAYRRDFVELPAVHAAIRADTAE